MKKKIFIENKPELNSRAIIDKIHTLQFDFKEEYKVDANQIYLPLHILKQLSFDLQENKRIFNDIYTLKGMKIITDIKPLLVEDEGFNIEISFYDFNKFKYPDVLLDKFEPDVTIHIVKNKKSSKNSIRDFIVHPKTMDIKEV